MDHDAAADKEPAITCEVCGWQNAASETFCGNCGSFLEWQGHADGASGDRDVAAQPSASVEPAPQAVLPPPAPPPPAPSTNLRIEPGVAQPGDLICGTCGEPNEPTRKFCRRCGNGLAPASIPPASAPPRHPRRMFLIPMLLLIGLLVLGILGTFAFFSPPPG